MAKYNKGMEVYDTNNNRLGTVDTTNGEDIVVNGKLIMADEISRVDGNKIYLGAGDDYAATASNTSTARNNDYATRDAYANAASDRNYSRDDLREGMEVFDGNNRRIGKIDRLDADGFIVDGRLVQLGYITKVDQNRVIIVSPDQSATQQQAGDVLRVPVAEERLNVGKQQVQAGEVAIHKTVEQQQVNVPVELRREEVRVEQVDTNDRPLTDEEARTAFQEGTIKVPVRGEQAIVNKETVVTGEVDIDKETVAEQQTVSDTVRRERVEVDKNATTNRTTTDTDYETRNTTDR